MIPYGRQSISDEDVAAVLGVLRSDFLTQGPAVDRFEEAVAEYCGVKHAVAVSSGTAALHIACLALELKAGDLLWTSPITFVATANQARYCGADVGFIDIDPGTLNLDVDRLRRELERAEAEGCLPRVVAAVDFGGLPADLAPMRALADRYGFVLLEDAAHSLGGRYRGNPIGRCIEAHLAMFSFHPVKAITTGEGGMIVTNDDSLAERLRLFRTHGITRNAKLMEGASHGAWYYQQVALGYNYRMTDIQAALGTSQLKRLDAFVTRRNELAERYRDQLDGFPLTWQTTPEGVYSAHHLFVIQLSENAPPRSQVYDRLRDAGIGVNVHYIPVHLQPYYRQLGFRPGDYPRAERYYCGAITLPLFPDMTEEQQDTVVSALGRAVS